MAGSNTSATCTPQGCSDVGLRRFPQCDVGEKSKLNATTPNEKRTMVLLWYRRDKVNAMQGFWKSRHAWTTGHTESTELLNAGES